ncbi:MAG: hypothetical protein ACRDOK_11330 [Streptosporangiaceae bacterium]
MAIVIVLAAAVILAGVVVVAMGRGGELARERPAEPAVTNLRTWSDVASYRPPAALLGYHAGATEYALAEVARAIAERDAEIDLLRRRLAAAQLAEDAQWQIARAAEQRPAE